MDEYIIDLIVGFSHGCGDGIYAGAPVIAGATSAAFVMGAYSASFAGPAGTVVGAAGGAAIAGVGATVSFCVRGDVEGFARFTPTSEHSRRAWIWIAALAIPAAAGLTLGFYLAFAEFIPDPLTMATALPGH